MHIHLRSFSGYDCYFRECAPHSRGAVIVLTLEIRAEHQQLYRARVSRRRAVATASLIGSHYLGSSGTGFINVSRAKGRCLVEAHPIA